MSSRIPRSDRIGLTTTIIVHLVVLIAFLGTGLGVELGKAETSFVLDFTNTEELERKLREIEEKEQEAAKKQEISERVSQMLAERGSVPVRNTTVNLSELKDDRHSQEDARKLYEDARRLEEELKKGFEAPRDLEDFVPEPGPKREPEARGTPAPYSGPSVLSWELAGRNAVRLPIPAYRCMGAGEVKVDIVVNDTGTVTGVSVDKALSSANGCLQDFAKRAARLSKFSKSPEGNTRQEGYIIYEFVAQ